MDNVLFIFAHQDDECFIISRIVYEIQSGHHVVCIFLTNGNGYNIRPNIRNIESKKVLGRVGVPRNKIHFCNIDDGKLFFELTQASDCVANVSYNINRIYCPAWEGGHQDHDASHLVALSIAKEFNLLDETYQFSLYNGLGVPSLFFRVLNPLESNGEVKQRKISINDAITNLYLCCYYKSQLKTWLALFPEFFLKFLVLRKEILQKVNINRTKVKPHNNKLYYERKFKVQFEYFMKISEDFRLKHLYN